MGSINVPLGFRFVPTDQELMEFLFNKVHGCPLPSSSAIPEVDVYGYHPSFLAAGDDDVDEEKFYFVKMKRLSKNKNGKRPSRTQEGLAYAYDDGTIGVGGWWKATTGTKDIYSEGGGNRKRTRLGFKRTLKFYNFKNKNKERSQATGTDWIMHEYNLNNSEFQEWVVCGIKYKGKKNKVVDGTSNREYLDDGSEALTTTNTEVETMLLATNQDLTIQVGGGTKKYEEEKEDLVLTKEEEEFLANINELLYLEDLDQNNQYPQQDLDVHSNNVVLVEVDQNSTEVLVSENEDLDNLNNQVVEIEQNEEAFQRHKHDESMTSNMYGFVNQGYQNPQHLQQVRPLELNSRVTEDGQNLSKLASENEDIENWNSPVVAGTKQNETGVRCCEQDDCLSSLYTFIDGGYDQNQ
ncbi:hypothetical protein LguiB_012952 [Lonicera macranthoides]